MNRVGALVLTTMYAAQAPSCNATEPPIQFETIEQDCDQKCTVAIYECGGNTTAEDHKACVEDCLDDADASLEQGNTCAQSFETMMSCVGTLETCEEINSWALRSADGACAEVSYAFDLKCEDFT